MQPELKTILLSEYLKVTREKLEEAKVFDSILGIDTRLFVDPKLLETTEVLEFRGSRTTLLKYFSELIKIIKQSHKSKQLIDIAIRRIAIKEPVGLSIGYGNKSDNGIAIPITVATKIVKNIIEIINVGIDDPELVELMSIFVEKFGPDSISDLTIKILYKEFCKFTERVSRELGAETIRYTIDGTEYFLPTHPYNNTQLIFLPTDLIRVLPVANDWPEVKVIAEHNEQLRENVNGIFIELISEILAEDSNDKNHKAELRKNIQNLVQVYKEITVTPYSLVEDVRGYYNLPFASQKIISNLEFGNKPKDGGELISSIRVLIHQFKKSIEENGANKILFRKDLNGETIDTEPQREEIPQLLFYMVADVYCKHMNISLSRESNAGRGPVDFSLSTGYDSKVLVEIKKSNNHSLIDGYTEQLGAYERGENSTYSFYVVIDIKKQILDRKKIAVKTNMDRVREKYDKLIKEKKHCPELIIIDGKIYPSPSKLKNGKEL